MGVCIYMYMSHAFKYMNMYISRCSHVSIYMYAPFSLGTVVNNILKGKYILLY